MQNASRFVAYEALNDHIEVAYLVNMLTLRTVSVLSRQLAVHSHVFVLHVVCQSDLLRLWIEFARLAPYQGVPAFAVSTSGSPGIIRFYLKCDAKLR
jgi:hypothetical protein